MLTIVIIAVIVIAAVILFAVGRGRIRDGEGRGLKHRFGPEYDRAVADHDGDTKAAERELGERVEQHGTLTQQPLSPEARTQYAAQWAAVQEQFVDSPQQAVTEADALLARVATDRGFPGEHPRSSSPRSPSTTPTTSAATAACTRPPAATAAPRRCARPWSRPEASSRPWSPSSRTTLPPTGTVRGPRSPPSPRTGTATPHGH